MASSSSFASLPKSTGVNLVTALTILLVSFTFLPFKHFFSSSPSTADDDGYHSGASELIPIVSGAVGPESFAFDRKGDGPYTGVSDGRIIKWRGNESRWIDFAVTSPERDGCTGMHDHTSKEHVCGRPLGLCFNKDTSDLYIADAYMGLLVVGPKGGLATPVATQAQGVPFGFTNALDIDQRSGVVYFTDSSARYRRRNYVSVIVSGDDTGRLMKFDPRSQQVSVLLDKLKFPNGVALSQEGDFILVAETSTCQILKYWLQPSKFGQVEVVAQLPGFPDNIKRNKKGEFWVGINSRRTKFLQWALSKPWIGKFLIKLPVDLTRMHAYLSSLLGGYGMAIKLSEDGNNIVEILGDKKGRRWKFVSEVEEKDEYLWIGSVKMPFAIKEKIVTN